MTISLHSPATLGWPQDRYGGWPVDLRQLEFLCALAREKHFGRAADACAVTQPTLSARLRQLEQELGMPIVNRGSRFEGFTPEGRRILAWAQGIVQDVNGLRAEISIAKGPASGRLRIGVIPSALTRITLLVSELRGDHPGLHFDIRSLSSRAIESGLRDATLDLGVSYSRHLSFEAFESVSLYQETYRFLYARHAFTPTGDTIRWEEVADKPMCLLTRNMQNRRIVSGVFSDLGLTVDPVIETDSFTHLFSQVATGAVFSIVPEGYLQDPMFADSLGSIPLDDPAPANPVGLMALRRDPQSPLIALALRKAEQMLLGNAS